MTRSDVYYLKPDEEKNMNYFTKYDFKETNDETLKNLLLNPSIDYLL